MKRRTITFILTLCMCLLLGLALTACNFGNPDNNVNKFKLSFIVENEEYYAVETTGDEMIVMPQAPEKEGYRFDGWYWDKEYQDPFMENSLLLESISSDFSVYAEFTAISYTITYETDGGVHNGNPASYTVEDSFTLSEAEKAGYIFDGWYNGDTIITEISKGSVGNIQLDAKWSAIDYNIVYHNIDGATHTNPVTYNVENEPLILSDAVKSGYFFEGWYTDSAFKNKIIKIGIGVTRNFELYAKFEIATYTIQYEDEKGTNLNPKTFTVQSEFDLKPLRKSGYTFLGWFNGDVLTEKINKGTTGNIVLTAKWQECNIQANKNIEDAGIISGVDSGLTLGEEVTLSAITNPGYTWLGWYDGDNKVSIGDSTTFTFINDGETKVYTAKWDEYLVKLNMSAGGQEGYKVTFVQRQGEWVNDEVVVYDKILSTQYVNCINDIEYVMPNASVSSMFTGWYTDIECKNAFNWDQEINDDITLYAGFKDMYNCPIGTAYRHSVLNFNSVSSTETYSASVELHDNKNAYPLLWSYIYFAIPDNRDVKITFKYAQIGSGGFGYDFEMYNVTQGKTIKETSNGGTTYTVTYLLTKDVAKTGDVVYLKVRNDMDDYRLYQSRCSCSASFIESASTVETPSRGTGRYAERTEVALRVVTNEGYIFLGWYDEKDNKVGGEETYKFTMPNRSVTFTPKWSVVPYTITYENTKGATNTNPTNYTVESEDIIFTQLTAEGYIFLGWEIECISKGSTGNKTVAAKWLCEGSHVYGDDDFCDNCEYYRLYRRVDSSGNDATDGEYIYFGYYPQTQVTDQSTIEALNSLYNKLPSVNIYNDIWADSSNGWTTCEYYIENNKKCFMWYIDVDFNGVAYRGVYFIKYRPTDNLSQSSSEYSNQDDNGYKTNTVYWFKFEPIKWKILFEENGEAQLLCDIIIDNQHFSKTSSTKTAEGENNYAGSIIDYWLEDVFYETAFNEWQREIIQLSTIEDEADYYGRYQMDARVFLLSEKEFTDYAVERQKGSTDYAKVQGLRINSEFAVWWLRTPCGMNLDSSMGFASHGTTAVYANNTGFEDVYETRGVVPSIVIKLS